MQRAHCGHTTPDIYIFVNLSLNFYIAFEVLIHLSLNTYQSTFYWVTASADSSLFLFPSLLDQSEPAIHVYSFLTG
jgi:hypothetical protein